MARLADLELREWIADLGGEECVSSMQLALLEDAARIGILMRAQLIRCMQADDEHGVPKDAATSAAQCMSQRRAALSSVGLERKARDVTSVQDVLRDIETAAEKPDES
ncbi:MAG: hypothetical protein ACREJC_07935 [Tepidisphaeraceae bacterium]